jgi:hypothetical protein
VLALLFTLAATSYAQSARRTVILIPFDFVAGSEVLPAGAYKVEPVRRDSYTAWEIRSTTGRAGAVVMTSAIGGGAAVEEAGSRLVFQKYAETYVLAEVWPTSDASGREVVQSRRGRALVARNVKPEAVTVMAHAR